MLIESVSILNFHEQLGVTDDAGCFYGVSISLTFTPDIWWKRIFQSTWIQQSKLDDRNIIFHENELLIELRKSDNIQDYIDFTKDLILNTSNRLTAEEKKIHMAPNQKAIYQYMVPQYALQGRASLASYEI